jgi:predicted nucleic acid-binding protein
MAGSIQDLTGGTVNLPDRLAIDTNVLATRLIRPPVLSTDYLVRLQRVRHLLAEMRRQRCAGFASPTVCRELLHAALRAKLVADLPTYAAVIGGKKSWELLFKARPNLIQGYEPSLRRLVSSLALIGVEVLQPDDLAPLPPNRRLEEALIDAMVRYQFDSSDAAILNELQSVGLDAIVTEDPDLRRAASDFDVYTWL